MATTTLPPRHDLRKAPYPEQFDTADFGCQQAGYSQAHPFSGLHFDSGIKGSLSLRLFCALYELYAWLSGVVFGHSRRSKPKM